MGQEAKCPSSVREELTVAVFYVSLPGEVLVGVLQARFPTFCWAAPCRDDCDGSFDFLCHTQGLERVVLQTRLCFLRYVLTILLNIFQGQLCTAVQAASGAPCGEEPVGSLAFHLPFIF